MDPADAYSQGKSEELVGQVLLDLGLDETRMLVATKVRLRTGPGPNEVGLGRSQIVRSVERSLKRIGRDHINLFQLHDRDALVPIQETLRALDDLVTQGKVRHIGVCNFSPGDLERVHGITAQTHRATITSNQVYYSLAARDIEYEIAPIARANDVALIVWSPLRSEEHTSELQSHSDLVCRLLLVKKNNDGARDVCGHALASAVRDVYTSISNHSPSELVQSTSYDLHRYAISLNYHYILRGAYAHC